MNEDSDTLTRPTKDTSDISGDVSALVSSLSNASDSGDVNRIIEQLGQLAKEVPANAAESAQLHAAIQSAKDKAGEIKQKLEAEEAEQRMTALSVGIGMAAAAGAFAKAMTDYMAASEVDFLNSFKDGQSYGMAAIDENGNITTTNQQVFGLQLKHDFALIKYHALHEEDRIKFLKSNVPPLSQDMDALRLSLDHMEGFQAQKLKDRGAGTEEAQACHNHFEAARKQIGEVERLEAQTKGLEAAAKTAPMLAMNAKIAGIALKFNQEKLGQILQKDVIDNALELNPDHQRHEPAITISQGVDVEEHSRPLDTGAPPLPGRKEKGFTPS